MGGQGQYLRQKDGRVWKDYYSAEIPVKSKVV